MQKITFFPNYPVIASEIYKIEQRGTISLKNNIVKRLTFKNSESMMRSVKKLKGLFKEA